MISFISSHLVKMAADSSKIYHHVPPLLRAFNLSKQPFSLPNNNHDANFSHRSSVMLTRSPSFPSLSFLPKNQPFSHFPSMTSLVAGITSDEWRDHHTLLLDRVHTNNPITKTAQPVFAGSFSFNRESSPNSSTVTAVAADIPPTAHASSLMQMWREKEVEAGLCPVPRTSAVATPPPAEEEEPTDSSDVFVEFKLLAKEIMGAELATSLLPSPEFSPIPSPTLDTGGKKLISVRGRQELEDFMLKLVEECRRERPPRLQSATQFLNSLSLASFRKIHEDESQGDINEVPTEESMIGMEVQLSNSLVYVLTITIDHFDIENDRLEELISTRKTEYSPKVFQSLQAFYISSSQYEDQRESQSFERSLWGNSLDCQKPLDSEMLQALLDEVTSDGTEMSNEEKNVASGEGNWLLQPFTSWRGWWRKE